MSGQRSWLAHYDPHVPATLAPYPEKTLVDYLRENASVAPQAPAVIFKGSALSYAELDRLTDCFAAALGRMGVQRGHRVALVLPNCPQFLIAELGAWKAGATVLPLNPLYTGNELAEPLGASAAKVAVVLTPFYQRLKDIQPETRVETIVATSIKEYLPPLLRILFTMFKERKDGHRVQLQRGDEWFQACIRDSSAAAAGRPSPAADDPAVLLLSGGTTGTPKAVLGKHRHLVAAAVQLRAWLSPPGSGPNIALLPLPLFHVYACVGVQSHAIVSRTPLALVPNPRDLGDLLETIEDVRPTLFSAVPALFIALLNHPKVQARKVDFSSIRTCFSGSAPLMAATKARFEELSGGRIVEGYSLTEAMMACVVNPLNGINKIGSVGIPLPDVEAAIVDSQTGDRFLANGETGEVLLRAPQLMEGYWRNPEETRRALRVHGEGGAWLHTGDLGYLDTDGYLFIVDRQKDLIKTSGYQVWPREIEEAIASHPAVMDVGVAGIPDELKGEVVKAWVVCRPGSRMTADELRSYCREKVAPFKVPAQIEFRESLPKTMTGKVLRRALVAEHKTAK
ncbi:MAG TPA: long-chain fatty acid--CoA ligase [Vicinamibacterales bacterium]|nr:long-chain fatty acid--CoA ligase [Vicinamibacterales bacterium]